MELKMSEESKHQLLMNSAYDKWNKNKDWTYEVFLKHLGPVEYEAVILGNLNYQVENGGFIQWADNEYCNNDSCAGLERIFTRLNTPSSMKMLSILKKAYNIIESYNEITEEEKYDEYYDRFNTLDWEFYKINNQVMSEFEEQLP